MPKFLSVIESRRAALQAQLTAIDTKLQTEIDALTKRAKLDSVSIRQQIKRLERMVEIYKENEKDFDTYNVEAEFPT